MALIPRFTISVSPDFESFTFVETTGIYNASTNTGGYGSPNTAVGAVTSATLSIYNVFTDETYDDITIVPTNDATIETVHYITSLLIDGVVQYDADEIFKDGKYVFTYTVEDGVSIYSNYSSKLITPEINCKLISILTDIAGEDCKGCSDNKIKLYYTAFGRYKALYAASVCLTNSKLRTAYNYVDELLENINCNC